MKGVLDLEMPGMFGKQKFNLGMVVGTAIDTLENNKS